MASCVSMGTTTMLQFKNNNIPTISSSFVTKTSNVSHFKPLKASSLSCAPMFLHCSFTPSSCLSFSSSTSSFSGSTLGLNFNASSTANRGEKRRVLTIVAAKKYQLCQTKRNRSRKSLARTHGFRKRMSTTSGQAVIRRRRAKGRWKLCTKTNPSSGKRA